MDRRAFLGSLAAPALLPAVARQTSARATEWRPAVFDLHCHLRPQSARVPGRQDGAGNVIRTS
jgi:hypothetical protein